MLICIFCYGHSLKGNFVFDDTEAIIKNKDLNTNTPFESILTNDFWGTNIKSNASHKSYRPVTVFIYKCLLKIVGSKDPYWFHFLNILLYSILCLQSYFYFQLLSNERVAFFTTMLFTVHPIHTEVVASVVGCADLLCSIFFYFGLINFHKSICNECIWRYSSALIFITISTFCKEIGITSIVSIKFLYLFTKFW